MLVAIGGDADVQYQANEAYESMTTPRQLGVFLLYAVSAAILVLALFLLPEQSIVQSRAFDAAENATDVVLQLVYEERKAYQPFVSLSIAYVSPKGRGTTLALKYRVEVLRYLVQISQLDIPGRPVKLLPGGSAALLSFEDIDATKFIVSGTITLVEGSYANLFLVWRHFNGTFALFVIFIDALLSFVLVMTALALSFQIASLTNRTPTLASRCQAGALLVLAVVLLPLPELVYLDLLYWIRPYTWVFQVLYRSLYLVLFDTLCWNLRYREEDEEKWLYKRSAVLFAVLFAGLAIPDCLQLRDKNLEQKIKRYAPVAVVGILVLNQLRLPGAIGRETEEFRGALLHLAIALPGIAATAAALVVGAGRFDKIEIYARMTLTLSFIFLAFIRWPFEGTGVVPQSPESDGGIGVDIADSDDQTGFTEK
jgi:hypothetical protein